MSSDKKKSFLEYENLQTLVSIELYSFTKPAVDGLFLQV
jgi:hypothetical protein